jgi:hypothetical protein
MGFNKKIVGEEQIKGIEEDLSSIKLYLKADCLIFLSYEVKQKFNKYEKKYISNRITTC